MQERGRGDTERGVANNAREREERPMMQVRERKNCQYE